MPDYELITPFPEADLPSVFLWTERYRGLTEFYDLTEDQFVALKRGKQDRVMTWGVSQAGELGGYIEFEAEGERVGFMSALCKPHFFRFNRQSLIVPALGEAIASVFEAGAAIILFDPLERNRQMVRLLRQLGARDAGSTVPNGVPEKRVMAIGSGDWPYKEPEYKHVTVRRFVHGHPVIEE